jgi:hypothetical protein
LVAVDFSRTPTRSGHATARSAQGAQGPFPAELATRIHDAGSDSTKLTEAFDSAPLMPREWLAQEKFGW